MGVENDMIYPIDRRPGRDLPPQSVSLFKHMIELKLTSALLHLNTLFPNPYSPTKILLSRPSKLPSTFATPTLVFKFNVNGARAVLLFVVCLRT